MAQLPGDDRATIELAVGESPASDFTVISFTGRERVNRGYRFEVRALTRLPGFHVSPLVGQRARLSIRGPAETRFVHGIVSRVSAGTPLPDGAATFTLTLVPRLSLLSRRKTSRIFQDLTVPEIVKRVAHEIGVPAELHLTREHEKRRYSVQYQETDLVFVRRLLAEEGLFDFFLHAPPADLDGAPAHDGRETWMIASSPSHYPTIDGDKTLPLREPVLAADDESVHTFAVTDHLREGGALVRGFDYERPKFVPVSEARLPPPKEGLDVSALRTYEHDRVLDPETVGAHVPEIVLDSLRKKARVADGEGDCRRLFPGATFELRGERPSEQDGAFVVMSVDHAGQQSHALGGAAATPDTRVYRNTFRAVPATVALRPKKKPRRPIQGTETATVVGPQGDEIHVDEMGRIKIQFHWDLEGKHDDHSSCWIRVLQTWAGQAWGSQFIPRVGMEVVVSFVGGDSDRPIVLGCVYNGATPTPFALPDEKTKSGLRTRSSPGGGGFNELSFDDNAGAERVYIHAERDFDQMVEHDFHRTVKGTEATRVVENRIVEVEQDNVRVVRGSETILIEKNLILHVAGHKLFQIGSPPEKAKDDDRARNIPQDASVYAAFEALASLPLFEDANAARGSQVRRSKILWQAEQLQGDDYRAGQHLLGRVTDLDKRLDGLAGTAHILTEDLRALPERMREAEPGVDPVAAALRRADDVLERARDLDARMGVTLDECATPVPPIAKLQQAITDHVAQKRERLAAITERAQGCKKLLADVPAFIEGVRHGGGGGATGAWESYVDKDGKTKGKLPAEIQGSAMKVLGPGHIDATDSFKITCGTSSIVLTPGSIEIKASGPVKINGKDIELNC